MARLNGFTKQQLLDIYYTMVLARELDNRLGNDYSSLDMYINVLHYILVTIYLLLISVSKQIFSSRNI